MVSIFDMLRESGLSFSAFDRGQHYCAAVIANAGIYSYDEACTAYLEAGGYETEWH